MTEANQSKGAGHASTQAHEIPEPGTLGKRGFFWASITLLRLDGFDPRMARS